MPYYELASVWSLALRKAGPADDPAVRRFSAKCTSKGIAATTADCQIASAALEHDCYLLTADKDFERIARISPIRLA